MAFRFGYLDHSYETTEIFNRGSVTNLNLTREIFAAATRIWYLIYNLILLSFLKWWFIVIKIILGHGDV